MSPYEGCLAVLLKFRAARPASSMLVCPYVYVYMCYMRYDPD